MIDEDEEYLINRFRKTGDPNLFGRLIAPYNEPMQCLAFSILRHEADASDAVQDAAIKAYQNVDSLADPKRFSAWMMRIVFGCSIDRLRSRTSGVDKNREQFLEEPSSPQSHPGDRLDAQEWTRLIGQVIGSLPERYRSPLLLFHLDGLNSKQVAEHLALPEGTVRSLLTRARKLLIEIIPHDLMEVPVMAAEIFRERGSAKGLISEGAGKRLNVLNGDAAARRLRAGGLTEPIVVWTDLLHEGPTPIDTSPQEWRKVRAGHLSSMGFGESQTIQARLAAADSELASPGDGYERVLWFEHDLYDQLLLIRHLHWLSQHDADVLTNISLICIGEFPGVTRFIGLGQLEPDQIVSLLDTRQPIEQEHLSLGRSVWADFCHHDPARIAGWLTEDTAALPYLQPAIRRHLQQYPSDFNGLGLTEQLILQSLSDQPKTADVLFAENQSSEIAPFLGDAVVYHYIQRLANEAQPALTIKDAQTKVTTQSQVSITDFGLRLLSGKADRVEENGLDRWFGGVQITGQGPVWRWDEGRELIVQR